MKSTVQKKVNIIRTLYAENPNLTSFEAARLLQERWGLRISPPYLRYLLDVHGIPHNISKTTAAVRQRRTILQEATEKLRLLWAEAYKSVQQCPVLTPPRFPWKVIFSDDQHGTFWNPDVTRRIIELEGGSATSIIFFEPVSLDGFSRFRRQYQTDTTQELEVVGLFFEMIAGAFEQRFLGTSNHWSRFADRIADAVGDADAVETAMDAWVCLFKEYTKCEGRVTMVGTSTIQMQTAIFSHLRAYLKYGATTVQRVYEHCMANAPTMGLIPPFEICAMGHTHRVSENPVFGGRCRLWETGCSCNLPLYAALDEKPKICTCVPMQHGYGRVVWDKNGRIDWPESRTVFLGYAGLPEVTQENHLGQV